MFQPISIADAAAQIRGGRLQPLELVDRCLAQIDRYEDRLHAWVVVDREGARHTAALLGTEAAKGEFRGPLHGIPIGIKDIIDVEGFATRAGSPLRENHLARADAPLVAALRRAGAIILGKTVTVEFACFDPSPTRNPWDGPLQHTPGGSSSGSAVAVALGMCPGALGTQTGGSLVRPASYCGIATCKPTFALLSTAGIVPVSYHLDHPGPMARRVADLAILLECLLGGNLAESPSTPLPPRLGLLEQFFMEECDAAIREATAAALQTLHAGGAQIEPVVLPGGFAEVASMHRRIMAVEAAAYHRAQFATHRQSYGPMIAVLLDEGLSISGVDYAAALAWQREFRCRVDLLFEGVDALIVPATDTTAPPTVKTTGTPKFQAPWSCAGVPVVSIPCGVASDGMPAALQLVARAHHEAALLQVARWCEQQLAFHALPPLLKGP
jgi:aspartyl-tRNA(Asn)/glutamyl-tRNA(Gln) amidotransferase subunit A